MQYNIIIMVMMIPTLTLREDQLTLMLFMMYGFESPYPKYTKSKALSSPS